MPGTGHTGKRLRLKRILPGGRTLIVPMDHGVSSGPVAGLEDVRRAVAAVRDGGANAIVVHKGLVDRVSEVLNGGPALLVHLSASTGLSTEKDRKVLVGTAEEAVALGADGVSVHVNVGGRHDAEMLRDLGAMARDCARLGMPLLVMAYPRGENVKDGFAVDVVRHVARVAAELGADVVKCPYTGDPETFREVVRSCPVPVVIAGGPRMDSDAAVLEMVRGAMAAGAAGASIGRNIFQHADPAAISRAIADVIFAADAPRAVVR